MTSIVQPQPAAAHHEGNSAETIARLQRGVLRLALAYHGRSPELDKKLKEFGALIRSGRGQGNRQALIDEIVDTIVTLDLKLDTHTSDAEQGTEQLTHFLDSLRVPETLKPEIENTQRAIKSAGDRAALLKIIGQAAANVSEHLMQAPDSCRDAAAIRMLLIELLERLPLSEKLVGKVSPLRHALEKADRVPIFLECVNGLASLVNALRTELQAELENLGQFLHATADRLAEFDEFVNRAGELQAEITTDTLQLSDSIDLEIQSMREEVDGSDDIATVRKIISTRLDTIGGGLSDFVSAQTLRASESNKALESMTEKLAELETQTEHLREDLERQRERTQIDPLTGILNRTGYFEMAGKQFARWRRYGGALSLAVIDLDLFKKINDTYGHSAGDRVLSTVATKLQEHIRDSDILCRYGGEEFVLLLPETRREAAGMLVDKLRAEVNQCAFRHKDTPVTVTLSCGVAEFTGSDTLEAVFERADQAMYRAKADGRNKVRVDGDNEAVPIA